MTPEVREAIASRLRVVGQRMTASRLRLVEALAKAGSPLTLQEILARGVAIPQSSAYRNLQMLEQAGVVRRLVTDMESARYELAEDLTEHHHHLVCTSCGAVEDLVAPTRLERTVGQVVAEVAAERRFKVHGHRLDMIGLCSNCA